jgi:hypothetical protein
MSMLATHQTMSLGDERRRRPVEPSRAMLPGHDIANDWMGG